LADSSASGQPAADAMSHPLIVAVVLNWNSADETLSCVQSLLGQSYPNLQVLVVDNASFDGAIERVRDEFPQVHVLQLERNTGYAGGNNAGIRKALVLGADQVLILNSDVILDPPAVELLSQAMGSGVAVAGPTVYDMDTPARVQSAGCLRREWSSTFRVLDDVPESASRGVDYVAGCALLMSRAAVESVGLFDDSLFAYCEEVDWCLRAGQRGYRVVHVPAARVWHRRGASTPSPVQSFLLSRNALTVAWRRSRGWRRITSVLYLTLLRDPRRALVLLRRGDIRGAVAVAQGVGWHLHLFRTRSPLQFLQTRASTGSLVDADQDSQ